MISCIILPFFTFPFTTLYSYIALTLLHFLLYHLYHFDILHYCHLPNSSYLTHLFIVYFLLVSPPSTSYASLVANSPPISWTSGVVYYEVEIKELGGEGRGVLSPSRVDGEGGQLTMGWATSRFTGESYNFKGGWLVFWSGWLVFCSGWRLATVLLHCEIKRHIRVLHNRI